MKISYDGALLLSQETVLVSISKHKDNSRPVVSVPELKCFNIEKVDFSNSTLVEFPQDADAVYRALGLFAGASVVTVTAILAVEFGRHWIYRI